MREENKETDKRCVLLIILILIYHSNSSDRLKIQPEPSPKHASSNFLMLLSHSGLSGSCEVCQVLVSQEPWAHLPFKYPKSFIQTQDLWVSDALQPSHPLSFPSSAPNLPRHQFPPSNFAPGFRRLIYWLFMCSISPSEDSQKWFQSGFTSLNPMLTTELPHVFSSPAAIKHPYSGSQFLCSCSFLHMLLLKINFDYSCHDP